MPTQMERDMSVWRWGGEARPVGSHACGSGPNFAERVSFYLVVAIAYFVGAEVGFLLTIKPLPISTLWPPNAIVLSALLLSPRTFWMPIIVTLFPVHMAIQLSSAISIPMALCWFLTNVSEALIGAASIRYFVNGVPKFDQLRDTSLFLIFGVVVAPFVSSFLDVAAVKLNGWSEVSFGCLWTTRFFSNTVSALVIVPPIITTLERKSLRPSVRGAKQTEAIVLISILIAVCAIIFMMGGVDNKRPSFALFTLFPLMIWSAIRFGSGFVSCVTLVIISFAIWGAQHWEGPLVNGTITENVVAIQIFSLLTGMPLILLSAAICELRTAELVTRNQKQRLYLALRAARLDAWTWRVDSRMLNVSGFAGADFFEYNDAIDWQKIFKHVHPDDAEKVEAAVKGAINSGQSYSLEIRIAHREGDYGWFDCRGWPQFGEDGKVVELIGVTADIGQRKHEEIQIQRQRDELAHLSRVAMLGEMSGAIAHELNQPLTAILCNAQAAQRLQLHSSSPSSALLEILEDIISEDKRASEIIQRMRELLKKGEVKLQEMDINSIIPKVLSLQHSDLICRNVAVKAELNEKLPLILADSVQLQQVLLNLIINACDAMQDNAINDRLIRISTSFGQSGMVEVTVSDLGKGVPAGSLETIFEPFISSKAEGLGLGLTICRSIITAHGGKLWATNNREMGTTFHLTLPASELKKA